MLAYRLDIPSDWEDSSRILGSAVGSWRPGLFNIDVLQHPPLEFVSTELLVSGLIYLQIL